MIDHATLDQHGLTHEEYQKITHILGREPSATELGIFSVMWSEHCSYKSSRLHLRQLPTQGPRVLQGPGENAGAVDIGDGLAAVFKIESHNHPSFIEPYQGAATGVGGIIRDIFTMGARPIALLNSLRFGPLDAALTRRIVEGVVAGIGGYGNSIGIPTIGGEIAFEESYTGNPLVNVFCLGVAKSDALVKGQAVGVGNPVYYVGSKTGRDGIHGATMASAEFDQQSGEKRPAVQVGDPFMEKLLLEACLEAMDSDALVGIQDMGAAGLTCSTCEMGARGGSGIEIDVSVVPQRETGMTPYEIMLSESQERMLLVVRQGSEDKIQRIFKKWDLEAVSIGRVTEDGLLRVKDRDITVAEIPNTALTDEAPLYDRPTAVPSYLKETSQCLKSLPHRPLVSSEEALSILLASPVIASKRWAYRQYDHMVRTNSILLAGAGAGVVRIKNTQRALAISVDGNGRYCYLEPYMGAMLAVAEAARNVACAGAMPVGATNCLNFGNPERPEIMWQLVQAIRGISDACQALDIPVTGGNVSLYNETEGRAIYPTPVLGVVGLIEEVQHVPDRVFQSESMVIMLLGALDKGELGGSEYLKAIHGVVGGKPPILKLDHERALQVFLVDAIREQLIQSAHDCSDGGFAVALAECCFNSGGLGVQVDLPPVKVSDDWTGHELPAVLFGESASRVIVSVDELFVDTLIRRAQAAHVPATVIGRSGGSRLSISVSGKSVVDPLISDLEKVWAMAIEQRFDEQII